MLTDSIEQDIRKQNESCAAKLLYTRHFHLITVFQVFLHTMPRPGNIVTRSQRDAPGSTSNTSTRTRNRSQNKNNIQESEKENAGRQGSRATRSYPRTGARTGLLGASTNIAAVGATTENMVKVKGNDAFEVKTASKGKRVPPPAAVKRKKLPLQDITAEFLPAPEVANREEDAQALCRRHRRRRDRIPNQRQRRCRVYATKRFRTSSSKIHIAPSSVLPAL